MYSYSDFILANQPMAYWRFNDPKDSTVIRDYSPNCIHLDTTPELRHKLGAQTLNTAFLKNDYFIRNPNLGDSEIDTSVNCAFLGNPLVSTTIPKIVGRHIYDEFYAEFFCKFTKEPPKPDIPEGTTITTENARVYKSGYSFLRLGAVKLSYSKVPTDDPNKNPSKIIISILYPNDRNLLNECKDIDVDLTVGETADSDNAVSIPDLLNRTVLWQFHYTSRGITLSLTYDNGFYKNIFIPCGVNYNTSLIGRDSHYVQVALCDIANLSIFSSVPRMPKPDITFREISRKIFRLNYSHKYDPFARTYRHGSQPFNITNKTILPFMLDDVLVYGSKQRLFNKIEIKDGIGKVWIWSESGQAYPKNPFDVGELLNLEGIPNPPCNQTVKLKQIVNSAVDEILVFDILMTDVVIDNFVGVVKQMPLSWDKSVGDANISEALPTYGYKSKGRLETQNLQQWISQTQGDYTDIQAAKSTFVSTSNDISLGANIPPEELFYKNVPYDVEDTLDGEYYDMANASQKITFTDPNVANNVLFQNYPDYAGVTWEVPVMKLYQKTKIGTKWYAVYNDTFIRPDETLIEDIIFPRCTDKILICMQSFGGGAQSNHFEINYKKNQLYRLPPASVIEWVSEGENKTYWTNFDPAYILKPEDRYNFGFLNKSHVIYFNIKCSQLHLSCIVESLDGENWALSETFKPMYNHEYGILYGACEMLYHIYCNCLNSPAHGIFFNPLPAKYQNDTQSWYDGGYHIVNVDNSTALIMGAAQTLTRLNEYTPEQWLLRYNHILNTPDLPIRKINVVTANSIVPHDIFQLYNFINPVAGDLTHLSSGYITSVLKMKSTIPNPLEHNGAMIEYRGTLVFTPQTGFINYTDVIHAMGYDYAYAYTFKYLSHYYISTVTTSGSVGYFCTNDFQTFTQPVWISKVLALLSEKIPDRSFLLYDLTFTKHGVYFYDTKIIPLNGEYHNATDFKLQKYKGLGNLPIPKAVLEYTKPPLNLTKELLLSDSPQYRHLAVPPANDYAYGYKNYFLWFYDRYYDFSGNGAAFEQRLGINKYNRLLVLDDAVLYPRLTDDLGGLQMYQIDLQDYVDCDFDVIPEPSMVKMRELKLDKVFNPTREALHQILPPPTEEEQNYMLLTMGVHIAIDAEQTIKRTDVYFNDEIRRYDSNDYRYWAFIGYHWLLNGMVDCFKDSIPRWYISKSYMTGGNYWKNFTNVFPLIKMPGYYLDKNPTFNWDFNSMPEADLTVFPLKGTKGVLTIESVYSALYYKNDTYPLEIEMTAVNGFAPYNFTIPNLPSTLTLTTGINKAMLTGFPTEDMDFEVVLTDNSTDTCTMRIKVQVSEIPTLDYMNRTEFTATDLPKGLTINPFTGEITGVVDYTGHKLNSMVYADVYRGNIKAKTTTTAIDFMVYRNPDSIEDFKCYKPQSLTENPLPINIHVPVLNLRISDYRSALGTIDINAADQYFHYHGIPDNYDVDKAGEIYRVNLDTVDVLTFKDVYFTTIKHIFVNPQSGVVYVLALAHSEIQAVFETSDFINFRLVPDFSPSFYLTQGKYEWHVSPFIDKWVAFAKPLNVEDISDVSHNIHVKLVDYMGDSLDAIWQTVDFFSLTNGCVPLVIKFVNGILVVIAHDTVGLDRERRIFLSYDGLDFFEIEYPQKETEKDVQYFIDVIIGSNNGVYLIDKYNKFYILKNFWVYEVKYIHNPLSRFTSVCKQIEFIDGVLYAILENNTTQSDAPFYGTNGLFQISGFDNTSLYVDIKWLGFSVDKFYNINNHCYILYQGHLILIAPDSFVPCNTQTVPRYMKGIRNWKFHDPNPDLHIAIYGQQLLVYNNTGEMIRGELNNFDILTTVFEYINFAAPTDLFYYFTESLNTIHINTTDFLRVQSEYTAPVLEEINTKSPMLLNYDGDGVGGEFHVTPINWQEYLITSPNIPNKNVYWKANYKPEKITKSVYPYVANIPYRLSTLRDTTYWTLIGDAQRIFLGMGWYSTSDSNHALLCFGGVKNLLKDNQHEWVLSGYAVKGVTQFNSDHLMNSDLFNKNILASGHLLLTGKTQNKSDITLLVSSNEEGTKEYKRISFTGSVIFPPLMIP